jgi:cell division protein FtsN
MKAVLILKGFAVTIVPISTRSQGTWFRVLVGPYPNRALAQKVQVILAKTEHLHGMVRTNGTSS